MATNAPASSAAPGVAATASADQPFKGPDHKVDEGDDPEWEYEYSATETETYYLTVDLSIPQLLRRRRNAPVSGRGGYHYKHWAGPHKKPDEPKHHRIISDDENDDEPPPIAPELEDDAEAHRRQMDPNNPEKQNAAAVDENADAEADSESDPATDIQILDLHSDKPMFAYKGKVFEGQWARNLGTEVIFAEHDEQDPIPALRHLPGDVDMLAASWSRINTTEKRLQPKTGTAARDDPLKEIRKQHGIHIPITADKTGERKRQTRFLENLMALKVKRGEKDEVTVYAHAAQRQANEGAGTSGRKTKRKAPTDGRPRKRRSGGRGARGRGGPSATDIDFGLRAAATPQSSSSVAAGAGASHTLSTPTPTTWADLGGQADDEDAEKDADVNEDEDASDNDSEDYVEAEE